MSFAKIRTILVAVADPSSARQVAVDRAAQFATRLAARVVLFHAAFEPALSGRPFFDSRRLAKSRGWLVADRTRQLERHAARLRSSGLEVDVCAVWEDPVHEAVVRAALDPTRAYDKPAHLDSSIAGYAAALAAALQVELPAQIIAMGIISRRWLKRFVIGDSAESGDSRCACDLLLIKPDNFRIRLGRSRKQAIVLPKPR